ncbi:myeloid-associated differentiation marker-like [Synchiropus splendidus]|uniref:myeloid-associated differentiation marker-like n=1 Tax=Synchiropus splendidus TaxID=270530 RepID=UPI00237EBE91|nr:myeloid-associated differentiation marker-like [Synchiropus splendidus]
MPVIVLDVKDFTTPLFFVRTLEVFSTCATFSLAGSLHCIDDDVQRHANTFWILCMFTWCFFFTVTLFIHILSLVQFHSIIPVSWKNLTVTVAALGTLMCLSASVIYPLLVVNLGKSQSYCVAVAVTSCLTVITYASETYILICTQAEEQRGYMGRVCGIFKIVQLWGNCHMITLIMESNHSPLSSVPEWQLLLSAVSVCIFMSVTTLLVICGDFAGRCPLPFDRFLGVFNLIGVLLYMAATVICVTKILENTPTEMLLVVMETVVAGITLLAYTMDFAFSIKSLCDRSH